MEDSARKSTKASNGNQFSSQKSMDSSLKKAQMECKKKEMEIARL